MTFINYDAIIKLHKSIEISFTQLFHQLH